MTVSCESGTIDFNIRKKYVVKVKSSTFVMATAVDTASGSGAGRQSPLLGGSQGLVLKLANWFWKGSIPLSPGLCRLAAFAELYQPS